MSVNNKFDMESKDPVLLPRSMCGTPRRGALRDALIHSTVARQVGLTGGEVGV